jgi:hypothetical protein
MKKSSRDEKPFEWNISTMNQMRTIESFFFTDDGFCSLALESYYRSIEMELTEIITQIFRLLVLFKIH